MTPFEGLLFFYILAAVLIVAAFLGFVGKGLRMWSMIASLLVLLAIFDTTEKRIFLLIFVLWQYAITLLYQQIRKRNSKCGFCWLFVVLSILPLVYSKLSGLIGGSAWGFLGISYLTFRSVQVIIELYDGLLAEISSLDYLHFMLFFPTISSGPIDRYRRFVGDSHKQYSREEYAELFKKGVWKLMSGVFYGLVISNLINSLWMSKIPEEGFLNAWQYMYAYTFYLFFNFAGYSRMAIGTGYILGIKVPENFNLPFISKDLKDFWARWHISLSTWFRDYIYTRFAAVSLRKKWFKNVYMGSYIGYIITMTVMGFWHGFELHYIVYGLYHGILMCVNDILDHKWKKFKKIKRNNKAWPVLALITFHIISFGMLIFSGRIF